MRSFQRPDIEGKLKNARAFYDANLLDEAQKLYDDVLTVSPRNKLALFGRSLVALGQRDYSQAEKLLKSLIALDKANHVYYGNLGYVLQASGRPVEAATMLGRSISLKPDYADAYLNRAIALASQGRIDDAIADYRAAIRLAPAAGVARANLAYTLNFSPFVSEEEVLSMHLEHARALSSAAVPAIFTREPDRQKVLKLGYMSSDFRRHSVSYFIKSVLERHDRNAFEIVGYYNHEIVDEVTECLMKACDSWRNIARLSDQGVARQIVADEIDILIDLNGYTAYNRLGVLAQKPAPIQCEWMGYPNTTGMAEVDYWICDEVTNPPGLTDRYYTESLLRLPGCFLCFDPPANGPDPTDPPFLRNGYVTFGSFNNFAKISEPVLTLWGEILAAVPHSRLLLKNAGLGHKDQQRAVTKFFASMGISAERIMLQGYDGSRAAHMDSYSKVDIALDSFPYNGTTTSCEAMWMGVPVISLVGRVHRARVGKTLLKAVGLDCLAAETAEEYLRIATDLSADRERLTHYRTRLRGMMLGSRLTDAGSFTTSLEAQYRKIWLKWCDERG